MEFLWPSAFILLVTIPLILALYMWMRRRRRRYAVRYSSLSLVRVAAGEQSRVRRYLPPALFLLSLAALTFGLARPVATTQVPNGRATVVLAMDVSGSMRQTDIYPSRLGAAKKAALSFVERQHENNQIAIVAFAGYAELVQPPTSEKEKLRAAIQSLTTARHTAIGSGILTSLDTISEYNNNVASVTSGIPDTGGGGGAIGNGATGSGGGASQSSGGADLSAGGGQFVPDIIVLLTDGVYTRGPDPLDMARMAADRHVRVFTIGYGTAINTTDQSQDLFFGGFNRGIDEESLKQIAEMTGGKYYAASSAGDLEKVFESLPAYLNTRQETTEITVLFAGLGALLAAGAVLLAQRWNPLP